MLPKPRFLMLVTLAAAGTLVAAGPQTPPPADPPASQTPTPPSQQPSEIGVTITGDPGAPPRYAVPDFVALSDDRETQEIASLLAEVLWNDLQFEREFHLIARDTYRTIRRARSSADIPFDEWRELGTDGLVFGSVQKTGNTLRVEVRLFNVRSRASVFAREYTGAASNPRLYAHTFADEIHQNQRALRGVARTKLTFSSDRDGDRVAGAYEDRNIKEVYIADYDGANQRRVTINRNLNVFPVWSADGRAIAFTSYKNGYPDLLISFIYQGTRSEPTAGRGHNWLSAWSPDGTRLAFTSNRDGNPEIYVMNRDGSDVRRLTNHPAIDTTPTWSPSGTHIAFTSDRGGSPQIYVVGVDGLGPRRLTTSESYADRPTWSPAPYNEIAFSARSGPGFDIKVLDLATNQTRQITFGEGSNESPAYAPNGRHLAFSSTRSGRTQIFTVARDGRGVRQITRTGNNYTPHWSP